jgi:hypothetical protein
MHEIVAAIRKIQKHAKELADHDGHAVPVEARG